MKSHLGAALHAPAGLVGLAEQVPLVLGPQRCRTATAAVSLRIRGPSGCRLSAQAARVGLPAAVKVQRCRLHSPGPAASVTTARHRATGQLPASVQRRPGIGKETGELGPSSVAPAFRWLEHNRFSGRDRSQPSTAHLHDPAPDVGVGKVEVDTELGPDHGHQLLQQATPRRLGRCGGGPVTTGPPSR